MEREEIYKKIKEVIDITLKGTADMDKVTEDTDLIDELGITSILGIEILVRLENAFGIEVDDDELSYELARSLPSLADYVENQLKLTD
jgi:acyl carrier protein